MSYGNPGGGGYQGGGYPLHKEEAAIHRRKEVGNHRRKVAINQVAATHRRTITVVMVRQVTEILASDLSLC